MHPHYGALPVPYVLASAGYTRCFGRTSAYLCTSSLQNTAVPQDFYSPLSVSVEHSCWPCIRWCGTGGFQKQGQCFFIGLSCSLPFCRLLFSLSLFSIGWYCGAGVFRLIGCKSLSHILALQTFWNNNNNNNNTVAMIWSLPDWVVERASSVVSTLIWGKQHARKNHMFIMKNTEYLGWVIIRYFSIYTRLK